MHDWRSQGTHVLLAICLTTNNSGGVLLNKIENQAAGV